MKKIITVICLLIIMLTPGIVRAEDRKKIDIYIFHGSGCPHCEEAFKFFDSIEDDYGKYYNLHRYETWHSASNNDLLKEVAEVMGTKKEDVGVPYIVIGDKVFLGYSKAYDENIKTAIKNEYEKSDSERVNKIKPILEKREQNIKTTVTAVIIIVVLSSLVLAANVIVRKKHSKKKEKPAN